jgi:hypothetical protein
MEEIITGPKGQIGVVPVKIEQGAGRCKGLAEADAVGSSLALSGWTLPG